MSQPDWEFLANLGDVHPLDHGGYFVFRDRTGVYPPEAEYLVVDNEEAEPEETTYTAYRVVLEPCTFQNGVLSDNPFHPDSPAWFADDLDAVARTMGWELADLRLAFLSDDPLDRARAYQAIGEYHGWENLDEYPLHLTYQEARERYRDCRKNGPYGAFIP